jgi:hypothetical protein
MTENAKPRRRGRPPLPDSERKGGSNITFRARESLRERLANAAELVERSISEEVEHRLNQSFTERDVIARAFGREQADLVKAIGIGLQIIDAKMKTRWGDPHVDVEVAILLGKLIHDRIFQGTENWAELLSDLVKRTERPGASAADVALSVLDPSPRNARAPLKV